MTEPRPQILKLLKTATLANLATITKDGKPWTRYVMVKADDDLTIRCATFVNSRKVQQIQNNPEVHLTCGINNPEMMGPYLQIQGVATFTTSKEERLEFWTDEFETYFKGPNDPNYGIIIIKPYHIELMEPGKLEPTIWHA